MPGLTLPWAAPHTPHRIVGPGRSINRLELIQYFDLGAERENRSRRIRRARPDQPNSRAAHRIIGLGRDVPEAARSVAPKASGEEELFWRKDKF